MRLLITLVLLAACSSSPVLREQHLRESGVDMISVHPVGAAAGRGFTICDGNLCGTEFGTDSWTTERLRTLIDGVSPDSAVVSVRATKRADGRPVVDLVEQLFSSVNFQPKVVEVISLPDSQVFTVAPAHWRYSRGEDFRDVARVAVERFVR